MKYEELSPVEMEKWKSLASNIDNLSTASGLAGEDVWLLREIMTAACSKDFDLLVELTGIHSGSVARLEKNEYFKAILRRAYEHGVANNHGGCCCDLGNLHHATDGTGTQEEFEIAIELYKMGVDLGNAQAGVNLGYIYYYGRGCDVDYAKAYECYSCAALQFDHPEAYWKLGDMYAKGQGVSKNDLTAWRMYCKAYELSKDTDFECRPAHHLADYFLTGIEDALEPDPEQALELYVRAELSYYDAIDAGFVYYKGCLEQAIEGQRKAREAIVKRHRATRREQ